MSAGCSLSCLGRLRKPTERQKVGRNKMSFHYVPEEIVDNILRRLPEKSLLRFRCVSKQWRLWISYVKITMYKVLVSTIPFRMIDQSARVTEIDDKWFYDRPRTGSGPHWKLTLLGSWDGVLLVKVDDNLFLWNPSKTPIHILLINESDNLIKLGINSRIVIASGLCFDSVNAELKAVMAFPTDNGKVVVTVGVESKVIEVIDFPYAVDRLTRPYYYSLYYSLRSGPVVNDKFHWFILKSSAAYQQHLLSFDPNTDVKFADLPLPEGNYRIMGLGALDGCLCMARRHEKVVEGGSVDVIVMKLYGIKESWEILFTMSGFYDHYHDLIPLFYTNNKDEVLLMSLGSIFTYNTKHRTRKQIYTGSLRDDIVAVHKAPLDED